MTWSEAIQIMLTGVAAVGSLLCLVVLLGIGRQIERTFASVDGGEFESGMVAALESTQSWDDGHGRDDRSD